MCNCSIADVYRIEDRLLGEGSYGTVRRGVSTLTGSEFAVKCVPKSLQPDYQEEMRILHCVDHPNIIKLHDTFEDLSKVFFFFELCSGGDLYDRVMLRSTSSWPGRFDEKECGTVMRSVLGAVAYLHKNLICHRDLKLENVMCTTEESILKTSFKVIDFGTACRFVDGEKLTDQVGSHHYKSPQVFEGHYDHSADMWSLGVMLYILLCGSYPFKGKPDVCGRVGFKGVLVSDSARNLVRSLLMVESENRCTAEEALEDDWIETCRCGLARSESSDSLSSLNSDLLSSLDSDFQAAQFVVGDRVEVKASVKEPQFGWSDVRHGQVGVVTSIDEDGILSIDFEHFEDWGAHPSDMQHAELETCSTRSS